MNSEFFQALAQLEKERGIPQDYMIEKIRQALLVALRKDYPGAEENVIVDMDEAKGKVEMYIKKLVVAQVENPAIELLPEEAKRYSKRAQVGDVVNVPVDTRKFGRIAAQSAKQVIIQGIRESERNSVYEEFTSKEHEILTGTVTHIDEARGNISISISSSSEYTDAVLPAGERVPTEELSEGDKIKVYVVEVRKQTTGPQIVVSRTHPNLIKRLFELEVPEIFDGTVVIHNIAREAGSRTKMAVSSNDPNVEPIGACVGPKGGRVAAVVNELRGEKIDIIKYSEDPAEYVAAALAPSDVISVTLLDEGKSCRVVVPANQLSLAIGKEGQNVRLAARLTGYKIDIKPEE
ncbi:MAG: transcription termination/antitermination protein NusA [Oscillospiraceae bacterium]|nr:transcription termination/antitermination protein NusA [Oscillospiraceae bacterium]